MSNSIVVSDAGPLMALAKLNALDLLAKLYTVVYASPIVYREIVTEGLAQNAADAPLLENYFDRRILLIKPLQSAPTFSGAIKIQNGERESIQLAIHLPADEFLIDDSRARQVAEQNFLAHRLPTIVRGTLGIIYLGFQQGHITRERAIQLLETIKTRRDIWIHPKLCDKVLRLMRT